MTADVSALADRGAAHQALADAGVHPDDLGRVEGLLARLEDLHEVAEEFNPDPGFVIPGLLPADARFVMVTGPSKVGKTWVSHGLVMSLGNGEPFLGLFPLAHTVEDESRHDHLGRPRLEDVEGIGRPQRTLYVQEENSRLSMEQRTRALLLGQGATLGTEEGAPVIEGVRADNVCLLLDAKLDLTDAGDARTLAGLLMAGGFENVVLDSAYMFVPGSLNDEELAKRLVRNLKRLHEETGCRVIVIHHSSTKGEGGFRAARESMGSTFFTSAWYDLELRVSQKGGTWTITPVARDHALEPVSMRMVEAGRWERVTEATLAFQALEADGVVRRWLEAMGLTVTRGGQGSIRLKGGGGNWTQEKAAAELGLGKDVLREVLVNVLDGQA